MCHSSFYDIVYILISLRSERLCTQQFRHILHSGLGTNLPSSALTSIPSRQIAACPQFQPSSTRSVVRLRDIAVLCSICCSCSDRKSWKSLNFPCCSIVVAAKETFKGVTTWCRPYPHCVGSNPHFRVTKRSWHICDHGTCVEFNVFIRSTSAHSESHINQTSYHDPALLSLIIEKGKK